MIIDTYTIADFKVGDSIKAFHPRMFGVVRPGTVVTVGRKWLHVDFGPIHGGQFKVHPSYVTANLGPG